MGSTIVALASGENLAAIALLRLSGEEAHSLATHCFVSQHADKRHLVLRRVYFGTMVVDGEPLDQVLLTIFGAPHSYTGEDMAEIACHGSPYVVSALLQALIALGAKPAQPGEFSYRAYLNGKLDLTQAEAVNQLIASRTVMQHRMAFQQLEGALSEQIAKLRAQLLEISSLIELEIDFSDQDVEFVPRTELTELARAIATELTSLCASFRHGEAIQNGLAITIVGAPNAGKSALLNYFLKEERAIVSDIPGTTRDAIYGEIEVAGLRIRFVDTAGLRATADRVEQLGIERTLKYLQTNPLALLLVDVAHTPLTELSAALQTLLDRLPADTQPLLLLTKVDLLDSAEAQAILQQIQKDFPEKTISLWSAHSGEGEAVIRNWIAEQTQVYLPTDAGFAITNARHFVALSQANEEMEHLLKAIQEGYSADLLAHHLRRIIKLLGELTGEIQTEDILKNIFAHFCIGK